MKKRFLHPAAAALLAAALALGVSGCAKSGGAENGAATVSKSAAASQAVSSRPAVSGTVATVDGEKIDFAPPSLAMLVNKNHLIPASYGAGRLGKMPQSYYLRSDKDNRFDTRALPYLKQMMDDAKQSGYNLKIVSGYRTYAYQQYNFQRKVQQFLDKGETQRQAETDAAALVNPPGTSEHETGLAADIVTSDWYTTHADLTEAFDQTPACQWLYAHCADYGFILRYPKGQESWTTVTYEPWHYRFVGVELAKKITRSGKSLEAYLGVK